jgi:hypothetical protein
MSVYDHRTDEEKEISRLTARVSQLEAARDQCEKLREKAERDVHRYRGQAGAAQVDADRTVRRELAHLSRVCAELVRRGVATDLVPDWWKSSDPELADAQMRAGWPDDVALADRCRQLEQEMTAAGRREDAAYRRMREAEKSRDDWIDVAVNAGAVMGWTWRFAPLPSRQGRRDLDTAVAEFREATERLESEVRRVERGKEQLAAYVRRLTRLPVTVKKLLAQGGLRQLYALADAIAPTNGPCALPATVVSEICLTAAEHTLADHVSHAQRIGKRIDVERTREHVLANYGYPAGEPTTDGTAVEPVQSDEKASKIRTAVAEKATEAKAAGR